MHPFTRMLTRQKSDYHPRVPHHHAHERGVPTDGHGRQGSNGDAATKVHVGVTDTLSNLLGPHPTSETSSGKISNNE